MPLFTMQFDYPVNQTCQVGDTAYYIDVLQSEIGGFTTHTQGQNIVTIGVITDITNIDSDGDGMLDKTNITCEMDSSVIPPDATSVDNNTICDYIFFSKSRMFNESSIVGYYGLLKFENNSIDKIELFSVGSEISESSK